MSSERAEAEQRALDKIRAQMRAEAEQRGIAESGLNYSQKALGQKDTAGGSFKDWVYTIGRLIDRGLNAIGIVAQFCICAALVLVLGMYVVPLTLGMLEFVMYTGGASMLGR